MRDLLGKTILVAKGSAAHANVLEHLADVGLKPKDVKPSAWAQRYADAVGLDPKVAALAQSRMLRLPIPLDDKVVAAEQRLANLFAAADQIPEAPDFAKWVDRRFNSALVLSSTT